jgi:hypothetical protein
MLCDFRPFHSTTVNEPVPASNYGEFGVVKEKQAAFDTPGFFLGPIDIIAPSEPHRLIRCQDYLF